MKVYLRCSDGSYVYSRTVDYSTIDYAHGILNKANATDQAKEQVTTLLDYAAAAGWSRNAI